MELPTSAAAARAAGSTHYMTGKPCKRGHVAKRSTVDRQCRACHREKSVEIQRRWWASRTKEQRAKVYRTKVKWRQGKTAANYRIAHANRVRLGIALRNAGADKKTTTTKLLGCSIARWRKHLENLFLPGMSWDNYGEWHVDHIIPVSRFNLATLSGQKAAFHFTNTQPLWAADNMKKGDRVTLH